MGIGVNLLPWREQKIVSFRKKLFFIASVSIFLLIIAFILRILFLLEEISKFNEYGYKFERQLFVLSEKDDEYTNLVKRREHLLKCNKRIEKLIGKRYFSNSLLHKIIDKVPFDVMLKTVEKIDDSVIIKGVAKNTKNSIARFTTDLSRIKRLGDVRIKEVIGDGFVIVCKIGKK